MNLVLVSRVFDKIQIPNQSNVTDKVWMIHQSSEVFEIKCRLRQSFLYMRKHFMLHRRNNWRLKGLCILVFNENLRFRIYCESRISPIFEILNKIFCNLLKRSGSKLCPRAIPLPCSSLNLLF